MSKPYLVIFCVLLVIPVVAAASAVTYICFKISLVAGVAATIICAAVIFAAFMIVIFKIRNFGKK